ncbi:FAD-binding protein [Ensifer canadensis]
MDCDVLVVGAGLAGLVAASEAAALGRKVIVLDQEGEQNLGGQAFWSLGGLFFVDSPEQRRMGIKDSRQLARQDWMGSCAIRSSRGPLAAIVGRCLSRFRCRREAQLAAFARHALVPRRRLGRARWRPCAWAWQFCSALPRHLGHRPGLLSSRSCGWRARRKAAASCVFASATGSTNW